MARRTNYRCLIWPPQRSTLDELTAWTDEADNVLSFQPAAKNRFYAGRARDHWLSSFCTRGERDSVC
jgi:hypothetical protein